MRPSAWTGTAARSAASRCKPPIGTFRPWMPGANAGALMLDSGRIRAAIPSVLTEAHLPELPNYYRGKVRENYDLADGRRILISTDRQSAFDQVLAAVPFKGQVLTETARFWF